MMAAPKLYTAGREGFRPGSGTVGVGFTKAAADAAVKRWIVPAHDGRRSCPVGPRAWVRARICLIDAQGIGAPHSRPMLGRRVLQGEALAVIKRALRRAAAQTARE